MKSRASDNASLDDLAEEITFWCAAGVMGYSLLVPLLAVESLFLAESALRLGGLQQVAMIVLLILKSVNLMGRTVVGGWKCRYLLPVLAVVMLLVSVQPSSDCCTSLVAAIAGQLPWAEINPVDAVLHGMPIVACTLIMIDCQSKLR